MFSYLFVEKFYPIQLHMIRVHSNLIPTTAFETKCQCKKKKQFGIIIRKEAFSPQVRKSAENFIVTDDMDM